MLRSWQWRAYRQPMSTPTDATRIMSSNEEQEIGMSHTTARCEITVCRTPQLRNSMLKRKQGACMCVGVYVCVCVFARFQRHPPRESWQQSQPLLDHVEQQHHGGQKVQMADYCYGAQPIVGFLERHGYAGMVSGVVFSHPSRLTQEHVPAAPP